MATQWVGQTDYRVQGGRWRRNKPEEGQHQLERNSFHQFMQTTKQGSIGWLSNPMQVH